MDGSIVPLDSLGLGDVGLSERTHRSLGNVQLLGVPWGVTLPHAMVFYFSNLLA